MSVYFNVNGSGFKGGRVSAVERPIGGFHANGKCYHPCQNEIRALLPHKWRKAFDRLDAAMWWPRNDGGLQPAGHMKLMDCRNRYLATIYANPNVEA